ncbi:MAG: hypothetical protein WCS77_04795 [Elusimicrobiaceae bacterium]
MKKIRHFKIPVHHKEIARRAGKAEIALPAAGITDTGALWEFIFAQAAELDPGVVYNSFDKNYTALDLTGVQPGRLFSAAVVTIGSKPYKKANEYAEIPLKEAAAIADYEFLETAFDFVLDLIKTEAEGENFETGVPEIVYAPQLSESFEMRAPELRFIRNGKPLDPVTARKTLPILLHELNAEKIDITLDGEGNISNKLTAVFIVPWEPRRKKKK